MIPHIRWIIIIANALAAAGVYFYCETVSTSLPSSSVSALVVEQQWLAAMSFLYILNFAAAFKFRDSFAVSASRMLFFGVAAFVVVSHAIDICGDFRSILGQVFSLETFVKEDVVLVMEVRARLTAMAAMTILCLTCIAVGFESSSVEGKTI
jgi:hypothetical protein